MYYVITTCCLKESVPPSSDSDSEGDDDTNLEMPKVSEVLVAVNVCRRYIMRNFIV